LVHRDEHFRERWSVFTCGVAPLFDQRGILAGAVNISSCRSDLDRWGMQHEAAPFDDARPHSLTTLSLLSPGASDAKVLAGKRSQRDGVGDWDAVKLLPFFSTSVRVPRSENRRG
jgi:hypothetical protein